MRRIRWWEPVLLVAGIAVWQGSQSRPKEPAVPSASPTRAVAVVPGPPGPGLGSRDHMVRGLAIRSIGLGETVEGARQLFRNHVMRESTLELKGGVLRLAVWSYDQKNPADPPCLIVTFVDGKACRLEGDDLENNEVGSSRSVVSPGLYARFARRALGEPVATDGQALTYRCSGVDGRICRVQVHYDREDRARRCFLEEW